MVKAENKDSHLLYCRDYHDCDLLPVSQNNHIKHLELFANESLCI